MTRRTALTLAGVGVLSCAGLVIASLVLYSGFLGSTSDDSTGCTPGGSLEAGSGSGTGGRRVGDLTSAQLANADAVIATGRRMGVPGRGILVALATASQESGFRNYANDGRGSDLTHMQDGIEASLSLPHEAVGTDHGSLGVFQQQWPWWGSMPDLMDPARSAAKFYRSLAQVHGWQGMAVTVAAQRVQRSAYPTAYADDEPLARQLLAGRTGASAVQPVATQFDTADAADCQTVPAGLVTFPLPGSASYTDQHNWGGHGGRWSSWHTGTDLSTQCGTPVLAATAGRVIVRTDQSWAGRWLVQVSTGVGQLTTWYAHMRALDVTDGQSVSAGERIGEVGDLGNATGCHLHFEVHPHGGSIYRDSVDPTPWLRRHVGRQQRGGVRPVPVGHSSADWGEGGFTLATFNVLGASHTARGGTKPEMRSGPARVRGAVALLDEYGVDVAGLQELQQVQYRALRRLAGDRYDAFPRANRDTENAIVWRRDRFQLVSTRFVSIPYFNGARRRMPVIRLRDRLTGATGTFLNVHNPADTARYHHQGRWRAIAVGRERALVQRLSRSGPVFVTGDMNDRHQVFCRYTAGSLLRSASGPDPPEAATCQDAHRSTGSSEPKAAGSRATPSTVAPCATAPVTTRSWSPEWSVPHERRGPTTGRTAWRGGQRVSKYPYFGVPPQRAHRPASQEPALNGKRVILSTPEGFVYDMRAASELRTDGEGNLVVDIVTEALYFDQQINGRHHEPVAWPAHLVWVD